MLRKAFTLIELLVVIAIIAILAAILFPVFAKAKEAAKKTRGLAQMKQLGTAVYMYATDNDDYFVPASSRNGTADPNPIIWTEALYSYVKNEDLFVVPGSDGKFAHNWSERKGQNIGYSDATGVILGATTVVGAAPAGTEGFGSAASFSVAEEAAKTGLFATTPSVKNATSADKERGYVFNPYNGPNSPDNDYAKGLPLIADVNICKVPYLGTNYTSLGAGMLKPIYAVYGASGNGDGSTPVIFADGHAKSYSAKSLNSFGTVIWRFR